MYITLFIIVLIVGLLMVFLPSKAIKNLVNQNGVLVVLRLLGIIMCVASSVTIYPGGQGCQFGQLHAR